MPSNSRRRSYNHADSIMSHSIVRACIVLLISEIIAVQGACAQEMERVVKWFDPLTKTEKQAEYTLRNNMLDGYYLTYYRSGIVEKRYETARGKYHGQYQQFLPNGTLEVSGLYDQGRKHGTWTTSYGSTGLVREEVFDLDQPVTEKWHRHERLERAYTYYQTPTHRTVKQYYYRPDASTFAAQGELAPNNVVFHGTIGIWLAARTINEGSASEEYTQYPAICPPIVIGSVDMQVYRNTVLAALNYCHRHPGAARPTRALLYGAGDRTQGTFTQIEWIELWDATHLIGRTYYRDWSSKIAWESSYYTAFSQAD